MVFDRPQNPTVETSVRGTSQDQFELGLIRRNDLKDSVV
jgi:hypothetical protein